MGDRVLVAPIQPYTEADEAEKRSGIVIPESVKKDNTPLPSTGIVVQLGEGVAEEDRLRLEPGTGVLFSKYAGSDLVIDTVEYKMFNTADIMATFETFNPETGEVDEELIAEIENVEGSLQA